MARQQLTSSKASAKNGLTGIIDAVSLKNCLCAIKTNGDDRPGKPWDHFDIFRALRLPDAVRWNFTSFNDDRLETHASTAWIDAIQTKNFGILPNAVRES
ncbi:hypothetical protein J2Z31_002705 [Sinorhizobium kostiense]|uniref:Uncharacterized protein n=1 Tax=Sinorhizobium kostiense TaxID=76747 RepID=A0ABS4QZY3_9HYPH|nr:hypothetical protein [Sinorhizobium kostiense]MBP2236191.1 hypothetical protein [Sinorhizobium kostiense]